MKTNGGIHAWTSLHNNEDSEFKKTHTRTHAFTSINFLMFSTSTALETPSPVFLSLSLPPSSSSTSSPICPARPSAFSFRLCPPFVRHPLISWGAEPWTGDGAPLGGIVRAPLGGRHNLKLFLSNSSFFLLLLLLFFFFFFLFLLEVNFSLFFPCVGC